MARRYISRTSSRRKGLAKKSYISKSWKLTRSGLEVRCRVITLRNEDVGLLAIVDGLVERDGGTHELLLDLAQSLEARLKLKVVVGIILGDGGHDSDVVALGADIMRR